MCMWFPHSCVARGYLLTGETGENSPGGISPRFPGRVHSMALSSGEFPPDFPGRVNSMAQCCRGNSPPFSRPGAFDGPGIVFGGISPRFPGRVHSMAQCCREHGAIERSRPAGKTGENSPDDRTIGCIRPGNRGKISPTTLGHRMHPAGESGENSPENIGPSSAPGREIGGKFPRQHRAIEFTRPGNRGETPLLGAWIRGFFLALFFMALFHKQNPASVNQFVRRVAQRGEGLCKTRPRGFKSRRKFYPRFARLSRQPSPHWS